MAGDRVAPIVVGDDIDRQLFSVVRDLCVQPGFSGCRATREQRHVAVDIVGRVHSVLLVRIGGEHGGDAIIINQLFETNDFSLPGRPVKRLVQIQQNDFSL
ncbi:hypothetical protein D3C85_1690770 [compost metagenome]